MKIIVNAHTLELEKEIDVNSGEYNIQECEFEFSNEYNELTKMAIFTNGCESFQAIITDNKCIIPIEVIKEGNVALGVYGYETDGDKLIKRYSPKPVYFAVEPGSYNLAESTIDPSSDIITQILTELENLSSDVITLQNNYTNLTENVIPTLATKEEIPTKTSELENDSNFAYESDIPDVSEFATKTGLSNEITNRENADINLQGQIDAITSASDVKDIVGTYADLQNYDTQHLGNNDVIKVLQDSTHNNAMTYYRWLKDTSTWQYIGQEGPYYTKSETDSLLQYKQDTLVSGTNIKTINGTTILGSGNIDVGGGGTSDYNSLSNKPQINSTELSGNKSLNDLGIQSEIDSSHKLSSDLVDDTNNTNKFVTSSDITNWNGKIDSSRVKSAYSTTSGDLYDITYLNTNLIDFKDEIGLLFTKVSSIAKLSGLYVFIISSNFV